MKNYYHVMLRKDSVYRGILRWLIGTDSFTTRDLTRTG
jgi:hypothetical protein